jgi:hypothetical protein
MIPIATAGDATRYAAAQTAAGSCGRLRGDGRGVASALHPLVERGRLLRVLVDLVAAELAEAHRAPDHVAVLVDAVAVGVGVVGPAHADGRLPRQSRDDHLVGEDLEAGQAEALQPRLVRLLAFDQPGPGAVAGEGELDVARVHSQCRLQVPFAQRLELVVHELLADPGLHCLTSRLD